MAHMLIPNNNPNIYSFFYTVTGDRVQITRLPVVAYEYTSAMGLTPLSLHPDGEVKDDTDADNFFYVGIWDYRKLAVLAELLNVEETAIKCYGLSLKSFYNSGPPYRRAFAKI